MAMPFRRALLPLLLVVAAPLTHLRAQHGTSSAPYLKEFGTMWTFDAPPLDYWKRTYGFTPDQRWLDHVRLASVRLPGCSASFVSANGLVMTNHHCGRSCTAAVSPRDTDYIATGFAAATLADEKRCTGMYVDQLQSITPVTDRIHAAVTAPSPTAQVAQRTAAISAIEKRCQDQPDIICQVVSLYQGGIYSLYRYKRFSDIRLVMAPEEAIAFYGGDPDNFTYPRYDLDVTLLRVYDHDAPLHVQDYLAWNPAGPTENELVFVTGNPGSTGRLLTVAQMEYLRDVQYPAQLAGYDATLHTLYAMAQRNGVREYQNDIFRLENSRKAVAGFLRGLRDSTIMARKKTFERDFRARVAASPALRARYGGAWDAITAAERRLAALAPRRRVYTPTVESSLLLMAIQLVRIPEENAKPDSARRPAYRSDMIGRMRSSILSAHVDTAYERLVLVSKLTAAQHALPATDPFLRAALHGETPARAVDALLRGTTLTDSASRQSLLDGGAGAIRQSTDPFIVLARAWNPLDQAVTTQAQRQEAIVTSNAELIGQAIFAAYGTTLPPDATFTLRITDGVVKGYPMNGTVAPYKTSFYGLFARASEFDNKPPFALPPRWTARQSALDLTTPFDFVSTNDIIGGNSGSPVIDRNAKVVGLIFDGNIESLPNRFIFTDEVARSVSVSSRAISEALRTVYGVPRIADELEGSRGR